MTDKKYTVNVKSLVEFLLRKGDITPSDSFFSPERAQLGAEIHRKLQKKAKEVCEDYAAEKTLSIELEKDGVNLIVEGRCDGFWFKDDILVVDEIKTIEYTPTDDKVPDAVHIAQALCYAAMLEAMPEYRSDKVCLRVFYYSITDSKESESHTIMTKEEIDEAFKCLTDEYYKWICPDSSRREAFQNELETLSFPFDSYRKGQRELAVSVYKTITEDSEANLYASAPTGIGKTVSVLFPSLKAMCKNVSGTDINKIFYLTAANSGSASPESAAVLLSEQLPSMLSITLTSKEKICPDCKKECSPESCPRASGHYSRVNACIYEALESGGIFTKERITELAERHNVCPFELQLDISLSCDVIIGDYNYLFDPDARLRRFFGDIKATSVKNSETRLPYVYLIDEAHNLPDRARDMYSATISAQRIAEFRRIFKPEAKAYKKIKQSLDDLFEYITNPSLFVTKKNDASMFIDQTIVDMCGACCDHAYEILRKKYVRKDMRKKFLDYYFELKFFYETAKRFDLNYRAILDTDSSISYNRYKTASYTLFCVNPSELIQSSVRSGIKAVFFSGTMHPFSFCAFSIGADEEKDHFIKIPSPFPAENRLSIMAADVSTVYSRRTEYYSTVVEYIRLVKDYAEKSCGGNGNFMFFFSSYKYMDDIADLLEEDFKEKYICIQPRSADPEERDNFIAGFKDNPDCIRIGMCVLGGVFSEGIDLPGSRLSGAVIVGVGMPMVCNERDIISNYHEWRKPGSGFLYAYLYPGMNKVLQAAGRVIRTMDDKGFVIFLDSRYFTKHYECLFPEEYVMNKAKNFSEVRRLLFDLKL